MYALSFCVSSVFSLNSLHLHVTCYWVTYDWFLFQQLCTVHTCWLVSWYDIICESWLTDAIIMPQFVHIVCIWNANINSVLGTWNVRHWNCNLSEWNAYLLCNMTECWYQGVSHRSLVFSQNTQALPFRPEVQLCNL